MTRLNKFLPKDFRKKGNRYFLGGDESAEFSGIYLGEDFKGEFCPSPIFLKSLSGKIGSITINEKAEWLFSCGRSILRKSIIAKEKKGDLYLVYNEAGDILGVSTHENDAFKSVFDVGHYLRREMRKKKSFNSRR